MRHALAAASFLLAATPLLAQDPTPVLDSVFAQWNRTDAPGCTVGVDQNGTRTARAYGMANLEYRVPLSPESVVESGSVAKQFTAATVLILAQQGKLSLDDDIHKYLPEVPDFGHRITIRSLLNHTSGIRDQWGLLALEGFPPGTEVHNFGRILDLVNHQQRLNFMPGAEYLYSNTGYVLSAIIVQRVSGKPFAQFSQEELFKPLGMSRTQWRDDYRRVVPDRATAYAPAGTAWLQDMPFTMVHGNGGLLTTVGDMLTWNAALDQGRIPGGAEAVRTLETRARLNDGTEISYALGLSVGKLRGVREVQHGGATAGYRTFLARYPDRKLSIAVFCNAANANPQAYTQQIAVTLLGLPKEESPPAPAQTIATSELDPLAGTYRDSTADAFLIFAVRDGKLTASGGGPSTPLVYLGDRRFWSSAAGSFQFERHGDRWQVVQTGEGRRRFAREVFDSSQVNRAEYVGKYRSSELDVTVELVQDGSALVYKQRPATRFTLVPVYPDGFRLQGQTIRFVRQSGRVTGFRVFAGRVRDLRYDRLD